MKNDKPGFTLLEIIVVVSIIGLLAALGTLAISKSMRNSRINVAKSELEMIATATLQMVWDTGKWPNGYWRTEGTKGVINEVWDLTGSSLFSITDSETYPDWKGPYYEGSLIDPWGKPYFFDSDYEIDGVKNRVVVGSSGPNGRGRNVYDIDNIYVIVDND